MPWQDFFVPYLLPSHIKYYSTCTAQKKPNREREREWIQNRYRTRMRTRTEQVQNGYRTDKELEREHVWNGNRTCSVKHSLLGFFLIGTVLN